MRHIGTTARGIRLPIINKHDPLAKIIAEHLAQAAAAEKFVIKNQDVVGITEAIVAKAQGNFASLEHLAADIKEKFPGGEIGLVFPILSRNRFVNILKGIVKGAKQVSVLLSYPSDEVGNPIMDAARIDEVADALANLPPGPIPSERFRAAAGSFRHPFTDVDYISLYESVGVKVYFSNDPRDILKLTPHVLAADIHTRHLTKSRLLRAGAKTVYTLADILAAPVQGSGFNPDFGILGSNISTDTVLKLFPRDCDMFIEEVRAEIEKATGARPEILIYGDGAFKDPTCGIWELADPVVSPAHTPLLAGSPNEIKMKMVADTRLNNLSPDAQTDAIKEIIRQKSSAKGETDSFEREGTTPRKYADLIGSLCDLISGSGDKGTPVVLVQGYFDNYADN